MLQSHSTALFGISSHTDILIRRITADISPQSYSCCRTLRTSAHICVANSVAETFAGNANMRERLSDRAEGDDRVSGPKTTNCSVLSHNKDWMSPPGAVGRKASCFRTKLVSRLRFHMVTAPRKKWKVTYGNRRDVQRTQMALISNWFADKLLVLCTYRKTGNKLIKVTHRMDAQVIKYKHTSQSGRTEIVSVQTVGPASVGWRDVQMLCSSPWADCTLLRVYF